MDNLLTTLLGGALAVWVVAGFKGARFDWLKRSTGLDQRITRNP
jgi:hypothetical protein